MHIHGSSMSTQRAAFLPTQATRQAKAVSEAARAAGKALTRFSTGDNPAESHVDTYSQAGQRRPQNPPPEEGAFQNIFVSIDV